MIDLSKRVGCGGNDALFERPCREGLTPKRRNIAAFALAAVALSGCARDVVLKPAASSFTTDATAAIITVAKRYDDVVIDLNEQNVRFLADNPACGLNTTVRLRTPEAETLLATLGSASASEDRCLSEAELTLLDDYADAHRSFDLDRVAPQHSLVILTRNDFELQFAAVRMITEYVKILADAADAPEATVGKEIADLGKGVSAIGGGAGKFQELGSNGKDKSVAKLFASDGPVAKFSGHLVELGGAIETIADQARDTDRLRSAIAGPTGRSIGPLLSSISEDVDSWSCIRYQARIGAVDADSERLSAQLAKMTREQRLTVVRDYLQRQSAVPEGRCGTLNPAARQSSTAQMIDALAKAHDELSRIAAGKLTPSERRRQAAASMQRLGTAFSAIASAALVLV